MTKFNIIRLADQRQVAWKNGGGVTAEIAVHPAGSTASDPFLWRLSLADVKASGPFSLFPGYDRILVQLNGQPMTLRHGAEPAQRLRLYQPHSFSGDEATEAVLTSASRDFNCIVRRDAFRATASTFTLQTGESRTLNPGSVTVLHILDGDLNLDEESVQTGDTVITGSEDPLLVQVSPNKARCEILRIELRVVPSLKSPLHSPDKV